MKCGVGVGGRQTDRQRQRETETKRQRDTLRDRQTDRHRERETEGHRERDDVDTEEVKQPQSECSDHCYAVTAEEIR